MKQKLSVDKHASIVDNNNTKECPCLGIVLIKYV